MVDKYKAIDLYEFYDNVPIDSSYLLISVVEKQDNKDAIKIKVTNKRHLDIWHNEKGKVKVLFRKDVTENYCVLDIPFENGEYRLDFLMASVYGKLEPVEYPEWAYTRKSFWERAFNIILSDYAVVFEKGTTWSCDTEIHMLTKSNLLDNNVYLQRVHYYGRSTVPENSLLHKCLCGEQIDVGDFDSLVDIDDKKIYVDIVFDTLVFHSSKDSVTVEKPISLAYGVNENLSCTVSRERLGIVSIFFSKIIMEEAKNNTIQYLYEYFFK